MTIICGTELKIEGIVTPETLLFNVTVGGTGPGVIDAIGVLLFPKTSAKETWIGYAVEPVILSILI
jgi:hypothetical protein